MIRQELVLILSMVSAGMLIVLIYDILVVLRELIRHAPLFILIEDFVYWTVAAMCSFYIIYRVNEGVIRGYVLFGLVGGAALFQWSAGNRMVRFLTNCIRKIRKCLINLFYRCKMIVRWRRKSR